MLKERIQTTEVEIPKNWEKTNDGRFKTNIPYKSSYGSINPETIPECVALIGCHVDSIDLYANQAPMIPDGARLIFTKG